MLIAEVHYTDLYATNFQEFRRKYLRLYRTGKAYGLYVQFSNFAHETMNRVAYSSPEHSDPVGTYAYPLTYVLQHPADIWYGAGARYLRVLQDHSKRKLNLKTINSEDRAWTLLTRLGLSYHEAGESLKLAWKHYKPRVAGSNRWAKTFLTAMQIDLLTAPTAPASSGFFGKRPPEYRIRTGAEQTKMLLQGGYDAIEDTGRTNKAAIINDREPEQIVFLNRGAFRVVEVFDLRGGLPKDSQPFLVSADPHKPHIERPLIAMLAAMMHDKIKDTAEYGKMYWTVKGRRIEVSFDRPQSYYDTRRMGEKKHREYKLSDSFRTKVTIKTERGDLSGSYGGAETFKDIVADLASDWRRLEANPQPTDWQPEDRVSHEEKLKAAEDSYRKKQVESERQKRIDALPEFFNAVEWVANRYGLPFTPNEDYELNGWLLQELEYFSNYLRHHEHDLTVLDDAAAFCRENLFGKTETLREQWDELVAIIKAAYAELHEQWWFTRQGQVLFSTIRNHFEKPT